MDMQHIPLTPFGRSPATLGLLAAQRCASGPSPCDALDKWLALDQVRRARRALGVTDRDLVVLNALLSFLPERILRDGEALVVFPSNRSLAERAHGMPESTLRRHLATLVRTGLVARRDSPNGKRYAVRGRSEGVPRAFGFDLRPLLVRGDEVAGLARSEDEAAAELRDLRARAVVALRDVTKLRSLLHALGIDPGHPDALDPARQALRRRLDREAALGLVRDIEETVAALEQALAQATASVSATDAQNERHQQRAEEDSHDHDTCSEEDSVPAQIRSGTSDALEPDAGRRGRIDTHVPLGLVLQVCPEILPYSGGGLRRWSDLISLCDRLHPMMGIGPSLWRDALARMGAEAAATALAIMLQRFPTLRNPGGYLRTLIARHGEGRLDLGTVVRRMVSQQMGPQS